MSRVLLGNNYANATNLGPTVFYALVGNIWNAMNKRLSVYDVNNFAENGRSTSKEIL